jgi:uncharacterized protein YjbI with pentapeptide repeats
VDLLVPDWRPNALQVLLGVRVAIVLIVLLAISSLISPQDGKTIWDTVQLLLTASIPIVIAFVGNRYTQQRAQDEALESYLDQVSQLLTDKEQPLHDAQWGSNLSVLVRARTLAVLNRLDGNRRASVLRFLQESRLIQKDQPIVDLNGANLVEADLNNAELNGVNLHSAILMSSDRYISNFAGINLRGADLSDANLRGSSLSDAGANLGNTNLSGANLRGVDLGSINLSGSDLSSADLSGANFTGANLQHADLTGADLGGSDLLGARVTQEQLRFSKSLQSAIMPDGSAHE